MPTPFSRPRSVAVVLLAFLVSVVPALSGPASGEESLSDLERRMDEIQSRLDARTARIESLRTKAEGIASRVAAINTRVSELTKRNVVLRARAVARADVLYRLGNTEMIEAFLSSRNIAQLSESAALLARVASEEDRVFGALARSKVELEALSSELDGRRRELGQTLERVRAESDELQDEFESLSDEYEELRRKLAAQARAEARAEAQAEASAISNIPTAVLVPAGNRVCPVAGAVSFVDSWGDPRDGHSHLGVDMMAAYGTPVVAIVSGSITLADYGSSSGYWIILSGDDGNAYWYMHNEQNLVSGGQVSQGQQIATVGDTGNAAGTPHLHFEFHPGGGAAVNPYPVVAAIC